MLLRLFILTTKDNLQRNEICWGMDSTCLFVASKGSISKSGQSVADGVGRVDMIVYNEETRTFQNEGYVGEEKSDYTQMDCHMGECTTIDIDRKHRNIVTGSTDTFISVIDCNEMITLKSFKCHKYL